MFRKKSTNPFSGVRSEGLGFIKAIAAFQILFMLFSIGAYAGNAVRFAHCDFSSESGSSWKAEIIHGVGLVSPAFYVTAFIDFGE